MKKEVNTLPFAQDAETHSQKTNLVVNEVKKSNQKLFDVVKNAYLDLKDHKKELGRYKTLVDIDRSTINKIIKIVENDTLMKLADQLPVSWSSLYAISSIESDDLLDAITNKKITSTSTLAEISKVRNEYQGKESDSVDNNDEDKNSDVSSSTSDDKEFKEVPTINYLKVDVDELEIDQKQKVELRSALQTLLDFGIAVSGIDVVDRVAA
jgi:hypothetical protein